MLKKKYKQQLLLVSLTVHCLLWHVTNHTIRLAGLQRLLLIPFLRCLGKLLYFREFELLVFQLLIDSLRPFW